MAQQGNAFGLIIPIIACMIVMAIRYKFTTIGYAQGKKLATGFATTMIPITEGAAILGLTVVGGLIASVISYKLDLTFTMGKVSMSVQDNLDKIMPSLIPLAIVLFSYWLLGKKKMNSTKLIFILIGLGMILGNLQPFFNWLVSIF